jgi:hypothetical protein
VGIHVYNSQCDSKAMKTPKFCPLCGDRVETVRHVSGKLFEMLCENSACRLPCVVIVDDYFQIPGEAA